ncbi:MAG: DUF3119 family protein [Cyanothece sp. SIO1E1]|nr:DUF3119 family protein [Cyanothece sp. SIO1E1]
MTTTTTSTSAPSISPQATVQLTPSYRLPVGLMMGGTLLMLVQLWVGVAIALFGAFLSFQAATIRLKFTATDLDLYRGETLIRRFPFQDWQNWRIFWSPIPILVYFKEVKSIHFMPILFDAKMLKFCLEQRCPFV